ncbi:DHS-like NAD/FAD-binding domain-containing protein [Armillaria mellea]|nr:DHS-like NAD/FAD-binding domain-containing protein [Armillaria mellea]
MKATNDYEGFRKAVREARHIVVLAGAGLSVASGVPTFRGEKGLWRRHVSPAVLAFALELIHCSSAFQDATLLATPEAFHRDPSLVWQFYHYRRELVIKAKPNPGHRVLALLSSSPDILKRVAPSATFRLVTQNIDNLSTRALPPNAPLPSRPMEMHGNLCRTRCTRCSHIEVNTKSPICPALAGTERSFEIGVNHAKDPVIDEKDLPRCARCGGLLRPDVVWFGEGVRDLEEIASMVDKECDLFLVIGTSAEVLPSGIFGDIVRGNGGRVAVFNIEKTYTDRIAEFSFQGPCEETLVKAFGLEDIVK